MFYHESNRKFISSDSFVFFEQRKTVRRIRYHFINKRETPALKNHRIQRLLSSQRLGSAATFFSLFFFVVSADKDLLVRFIAVVFAASFAAADKRTPAQRKIETQKNQFRFFLFSSFISPRFFSFFLFYRRAPSSLSSK